MAGVNTSQNHAEALRIHFLILNMEPVIFVPILQIAYHACIYVYKVLSKSYLGNLRLSYWLPKMTSLQTYSKQTIHQHENIFIVYGYTFCLCTLAKWVKYMSLLIDLNWHSWQTNIRSFSSPGCLVFRCTLYVLLWIQA